MLDQDYKGWHISHNYQQGSTKYKEINNFIIYSPNMLDIVAEEFETIQDAKNWIDENKHLSYMDKITGSYKL